jgi:hypothetical protein
MDSLVDLKELAATRHCHANPSDYRVISTEEYIDDLSTV